MVFQDRLCRPPPHHHWKKGRVVFQDRLCRRPPHWKKARVVFQDLLGVGDRVEARGPGAQIGGAEVVCEARWEAGVGGLSEEGNFGVVGERSM